MDERQVSVASFAGDFQRFLQAMGDAAPTVTSLLAERLAEHLGTDPLQAPVISEAFDPLDHPNVQVGLQSWLAHDGRSGSWLGVSAQQKRFVGLSMSDLLAGAPRAGTSIPQEGPVDYINLPIGPDRTLPCVQYGLLLAVDAGAPFVVLVRGPDMNGPEQQVTVEVMGNPVAQAERFIRDLRQLIGQHNIYRNQVVTLAARGPRFRQAITGGPVQATFLPRPEVQRQDIVLAPGVLERVERHVVGFGHQTERLRAAGRHLRRGLLLHGSPGTGKTLTVRYLMGRLVDRTVLVLSGQSLGLIGPSCAMARALQPSLVVLEDVDLVAEERTLPGGARNPLLFELLNEMDGVADDADVAFLLTTNRADLLEPALAARPGRVDLAVAIDLPDPTARLRLIQLYGRGLDMHVDNLDNVVDRTEGVSAAFIRELLRRAAHTAADRFDDTIVLDNRSLNDALEELLDERQVLTRVMLGSQPHP